MQESSGSSAVSKSKVKDVCEPGQHSNKKFPVILLLKTVVKATDNQPVTDVWGK